MKLAFYIEKSYDEPEREQTTHGKRITFSCEASQRIEDEAEDDHIFDGAYNVVFLLDLSWRVMRKELVADAKGGYAERKIDKE